MVAQILPGIQGGGNRTRVRRSDCVSQARKPQAIRSLFGYFSTWQAPRAQLRRLRNCSPQSEPPKWPTETNAPTGSNRP